MVLFTALCLAYRQTNDFVHDLCYFLYWLGLLLLGSLCMANLRLLDSVERNRRPYLTLAFLTLVAINYLRWNGLEPFDVLPAWKTDYRTYVFLTLFPVTAWCWVFAAIGYGKKYLNKPHAALGYLNQAAYPFYILHQTVIVVLVYYVVQTSDTILMKFLFTVLFSLVVTVAIYHTLIRPFALTRFLFGMKPDKKSISLPGKTTGKEMVTAARVVS